MRFSIDDATVTVIERPSRLHICWQGAAFPDVRASFRATLSAIKTRVQALERTPAYAARLLVQQAMDKLDAGMSVQDLTDAELDALCESLPAQERAHLAALTDDQLEFLLVVLGARLTREGLDLQAATRRDWEHFLAAADPTTRDGALAFLRTTRTWRQRDADATEEE